MQFKVIQKTETILADGKEEIVTFETLGPDGAKRITKCFGKRIDLGGSYTQITTVGVPSCPSGAPDGEKARLSLDISIIDGVKGEVEGDYRKDKIRLTVIRGDGTVSRFPEKEVSVLMNKGQFDNMSNENLSSYMDDFRKQKFDEHS